jgi:hypothetical protein
MRSRRSAQITDRFIGREAKKGAKELKHSSLSASFSRQRKINISMPAALASMQARQSLLSRAIGRHQLVLCFANDLGFGSQLRRFAHPASVSEKRMTTSFAISSARRCAGSVPRRT